MSLGRVERAKLDMIKTTRTKIRLKYALLADDELRDVLPLAIREFDARVTQARLRPHEPIQIAGILAEVAEVLDRRVGDAGD